MFQVFPVSIGKDNGVRTPLKAVGNSREVSGTIGKRAIRSIGSHLRFPAPSSSFVAKTMQASAEESSLILCRAQFVLCKINIGYFLFHHFSFTWQLVALWQGQKRQIYTFATTQIKLITPIRFKKRSFMSFLKPHTHPFGLDLKPKCNCFTQIID